MGHIGRYELLRRLGIGGMGEVFLARSTGVAGFETEVCIKRILPHLAGQPDFVRRFVEEGKLVSRLRHAGIAQVLDLGEDGGEAYLAMEYVDGADLRALMRRARRGDGANEVDLQPDPGIVVWILIQVLDALEYAHGQGVIHRDVSPSNIMLAQSGHVKLVDFGLARAADRLSLSASGAIQGKFSYMSPEQAGGRELDARSDLFSVGVTAWEMFVGSRPFDGSTDLQTLDKVRGHDQGRLLEACPTVPEAVGTVIDTLLNKSVEARYSSAGDARQALATYLATSGVPLGAPEVADWMAQVRSQNEASGASPVPAPGGHSMDGALDAALAAALQTPIAGGGQTQTAAAAPIEPLESPQSLFGPSSGLFDGVGTTSTAPASVHVSATTPAEPALVARSYDAVLVHAAPIPVATDVATLASQPSTPSQPSQPSVVSTPSGMLATRTSRWAVALLVTFNVLLLAAVGFLLYELTQDDPPRPSDGGNRSLSAGTAGQLGTGPAIGAVGTPVKAGVSTAPDAAAHIDTVSAPLGLDVAVNDASMAPNDTARSETANPDAGPDVIGFDGDAAIGTDGIVTDVGAYGTGADSTDEGRAAVRTRKLTVTVVPANARVSVRGYGTAASGRGISVKHNANVRVTVTAKGHKTKRFRIRMDRDRAREIELAPHRTGLVTFRFFPANAKVAIDGAQVSSKTNVIRRRLTPGSHSLRVAVGGAKRTVTFEVKADQTTNLGTVRLK